MSNLHYRQFGPDCFYEDDFDDEGLSDDNDYYEFQEKLKLNQEQAAKEINSEEDQKKRQLQIVFAAIIHGNAKTAFDEIDKGLDVNIDLESGWTPLLLAATVSNLDIISGLINRGADVNHKRDDGTTPLMLLCNINSKEESTRNDILACIRLLLEREANPNAIDNKRRTAIMFAATNGHLEIVKLLLPLVDIEAEDNQKWNILFWAIDGNSMEVVKFLFSIGNFSIDKTDVRDNTAFDLANSNDFQEIVELFAKETSDDFYLHLNNNQLNFEEIFSDLGKDEKPLFLSDICKILNGTRSESVLPVLLENNINLLEFLSMTESKLEEIGVPFPYQRNRILGGIYRFHKHPFKPQSIPFVKRDQLYTNIEVSSTVLTCIKQTIAMEASLRFIMENYEGKLSLPESKETQILISKCRHNIKRLKIVTQQLAKKTKQWDLLLKPADKITKKRKNIPWCNLWLSIGVVSISLIILYKLR